MNCGYTRIYYQLTEVRAQNHTVLCYCEAGAASRSNLDGGNGIATSFNGRTRNDKKDAVRLRIQRVESIKGRRHGCFCIAADG